MVSLFGEQGPFPVPSTVRSWEQKDMVTSLTVTELGIWRLERSLQLGGPCVVGAAHCPGPCGQAQP
jgi:hypothetical protein